MAEHFAGDLVAYEKLPRIKSARFLFVVLGPAPPDLLGRPRTFVQMVDFQMMWGWMPTVTPVAVITSELTPIEEYGVRLKAVDHSRGPREFRLERLGDPGPGREFFGDRRFAGTSWDVDVQASLRDDLFDLVRDRLCEIERQRTKRKAA